MHCRRIIDIHQVVDILLTAAERTIARQFVIVNTVSIAHMILREDVSAQSLVAGKRKYARRIQRISLIRSLDGSNHRIGRLQIFVCRNILDERTVDKEEFKACSKRKNARLLCHRSFPLCHKERYRDNHQHQHKARDSLAGGRIHHDFVERLKVRRGNRIFQKLLAAHEHHTQVRKTDKDAGLQGTRSSWESLLESFGQVCNRKLFLLVIEAHHAKAEGSIKNHHHQADRANESRPGKTGN